MWVKVKKFGLAAAGKNPGLKIGLYNGMKRFHKVV